MGKLHSEVGLGLLADMRENIRVHLGEIDQHIGMESSSGLDSLIAQLDSARSVHVAAADEVLNDIFVLETYVRFFIAYGDLWSKISKGLYSESWRRLQDANDLLRLIRKWSGITLAPFDKQLSALETLYPYKIFSSIGFVVERFECSICGNDIDSFECLHRKNELYRGVRAIAIARNIQNIDHIAIVENPVDKRCVFTIPDDAPGFSGVEFLAHELNRKNLAVSNFGDVQWGKKQVANSEFEKLGRNDQCHCKSGKKFKRCCINLEFREIDHAEIVRMMSLIERSEGCL